MSLRLLAPLLGLCVATSSLPAQSSVWKATRGSSTFYLGGTCHVLRNQDLPLPAEFDQAFAASSTLYFETDVGRLQSPETQQRVLTEGMFQDGRSLEQVLTPAAWKAARAYGAKAGLPIGQMSMMKPWLLTVMMAVLELQKLGVTMEGVDLRYYKMATEAGKKTGALESYERHLAFLTNMGAGHESEMVTKSIEDLDAMPAMINQLLTAWKTGDLTKIEELMLREMRAKYPAIYQELVVSRNNAWLPEIEALAKTPEVEFILAGAAHMAGKDGLIAKLRAKGFTITQLNAASAVKKK